MLKLPRDHKMNVEKNISLLYSSSLLVAEQNDFSPREKKKNYIARKKKQNKTKKKRELRSVMA